MARGRKKKNEISLKKSFFKKDDVKVNRNLKKGRFDKYEIAYIRQHYLIKSDREIAEFLNRDVLAVTRKRRDLGLAKNIGRPQLAETKERLKLKTEEQIDREIYATLTPKEKKKLFKTKFENTERFLHLQQVLSKEELDFYSERFLDYMYTFETILTTEEDTLHLAIMELIRQNRLLLRQERIRRKLEEGNKDISVDTLDILNKQYKESVDTFNKLMASLNATRQQRLAQSKENSFSLVTVVQALMDEENRKKIGREAAIIEAATKSAKKIMREKNYLLD